MGNGSSLRPLYMGVTWAAQAVCLEGCLPQVQTPLLVNVLRGIGKRELVCLWQHSKYLFFFTQRVVEKECKN